MAVPGSQLKPLLGQSDPALARSVLSILYGSASLCLPVSWNVRGPRHSVRKGKTSALSAEEMRVLLKSIKLQDKKGRPILIGLRDRALIGFDGPQLPRV
jgi:hypothetical protein